MSGLSALFLTALLAAFTRFTESVGPVVRCEPCDSHALTLCKPLLPRDCLEPVREPGCGCCLTCALREGQACGVYTSRCGRGLRCRLRPHETRPLQALLEGRGVCTPVSTEKTLTGVILPTGKHGKLAVASIAGAQWHDISLSLSAEVCECNEKLTVMLGST